MRNRLSVFLLLAAGLLHGAAPLFAHHGVAEYQMNKRVVVKGIVTSYEFTNPHVEIYIDTKDAKGRLEKWQGEMTSPNMLIRNGWARTTLHVNDQVTLIGFPSKRGDSILRVEKVLGPDGKELPGAGAHNSSKW